MKTKRLTIDITEREYVELDHAFRCRGYSSLKGKVASMLQDIDKIRGVETSPNDWYHPKNKGEFFP